ncbi:MAG: carboxypeptidase M32 [Candidatus Promineifilaceae bacterium]
MEKRLAELKLRLREINDLEAAAALLSWDQTTYMPPGGAKARGRQIATLSRISHERACDPALGRLLDELAPFEESLPYDSDEASLIRVARRDYERAIKVPPSLLGELWQHGAESFQVWSSARAENDFPAVAPYLQKTIDLSLQLADCFPGYDHPADPLIDWSDPGMSTQAICVLFKTLRAELVPLVQAVAEQSAAADDSFLLRYYPPQRQLDFGLGVAVDYGYDLACGRQDISRHPYMTSFSIHDVRMTTRVDENNLSDGLFSTLHEAGHAIYEQGVNPDYEATALAGGASSGVHESQSRLYENLVGRSLPMWRHYYPALVQTFPEQLGAVPLEDFHRAINKVRPSLIRTEADELTYNLHVMIRFDLELALLEGRLAVKDLPEAWHARYRSDLGLSAENDIDGVLQDVHWYQGVVGGAFQGYTLGNIMSGAFFQAAQEALPELPQQIENGQFGPLLGWLRENIHRHGRKYTPNELVERVTGGPLTIEPYMHYLRQKYGAMYSS